MKSRKKNLSLILLTLIVPALAWSVFSSNNENYSFTKKEKLDQSRQLQNEDSSDVSPFPAVLVKNDSGVSGPIRMSALNMSVEVIGNIATTTMEMTFHNDSNRVLEGQLYFPLGEGQTVSRFAMEVDGKLREGVVVEKNKGQEVFESVIRRQIDPGLLEWTKGNNFKARVYPLEPDKNKRIVVAFEQEMTMNNSNYTLHLPMNFEDKFDNFWFKFKSYNQQGKPSISKESNLKIRFESVGNGFTASLKRTDYLANRAISIKMPIEKGGNQIITEKIPGTNKHYYYASFPEREMGGEAPKYASVGLIWDASNSAKNRTIEKEFDFLEQYFQWNNNAEIHLYILRNDLEEIKGERLNANDFGRLKDLLRNIPFDGGSAYDQIDYSKLKGDALMVFGDGLSNFGEQNLQLADVPIFTVNSSPSANHSHLKYISSATGGEYINLTNTKAENALKRLQSASFYYFGNNVSESYPTIPTAVDGYIHVAGIIDGATDISFEFGTIDNRQQVEVTIDPSKYETDSGLLRRIWAQKKLADLDINHKKNKREITELGTKYSLVTRYTSLIVLDRIEDYVEHEIMPPPELRKEYYAAIEEKRGREESERSNHIKKVKEDFKNYVVWWNTDVDLSQILEEDKKLREERLSASEERAISSDSTVLSGQVFYSMDAGAAQSLEETEEMNISYNFSSNSDAISSGVNAEFKGKDRLTGKRGKISLAKWEPDAAYIEPLKNASNQDVYAKYLELKKKHGETPSFFLDASDIFLEKGLNDIAIRVLSNIAEFELENHELMRVLAHRLEQLEYYGLAAAMYQEVLEIRKEEPQSYRDLGLCLAKKGEYQKAVNLLYSLAIKPWDNRFPGIETIALVEMNRIIAKHSGKVNTERMDPELIKAMPTDVRVVLNWDSDNCDMDLWVTDPRGEKCFYSNKNTKIGGRMSNDFTRGYGPEQFVLKTAMKGDYKVQVNYYGTSSQRVSGPTTIQVQMITNYGKPNETIQEVTRRLGESKEVLDIGSFAFQ
ncbi:MAG: VIT domain-containing protein [Fluviicola sp.]